MAKTKALVEFADADLLEKLTELRAREIAAADAIAATEEAGNG
jgi:hypothetical protein